MRISNLSFLPPMLNDVSSPSAILKFSSASKDARVEFNEKFQHEDGYDKDVFKGYGDLNTTLIFVSSSLACVTSSGDLDDPGASRLDCYPRSRLCSSLTHRLR